MLWGKKKPRNGMSRENVKILKYITLSIWSCQNKKKSWKVGWHSSLICWKLWVTSLFHTFNPNHAGVKYSLIVLGGGNNGRNVHCLMAITLSIIVNLPFCWIEWFFVLKGGGGGVENLLTLMQCLKIKHYRTSKPFKITFFASFCSCPD